MVTNILEDKRGIIKIEELCGKEYLFIFTRKGYLRGGEIHRGWQRNIILSGSVRWSTTKFLGSKEVTYFSERFFSSNDIILTPAEVPHMMEALEDTLMLEWREFPIENPVEYYRPYRDMIERMK